MRTFAIVTIITALAVPAYAQTKTDAQKAEEAKQEKVNEKAYRDSLKQIPKSDQKVDPWAKMR